MKTLIMFASFAGVFAFTGCRNEDEIGRIDPIYVKHFINNYRAVERFFLEANGSDSLEFWFDGRLYSEDSKNSDDMALFLEFAEMNGDDCNRKLPGHYVIVPRVAFENIVSFDIRCDKSWDEAHPAGVSLGDICVMGTWSYADCITGDYKYLTPGWIANRVENLTDGDMKMMMASWDRQQLWRSSLKFLNYPSATGTYTLTVTIKTFKGNELSAKQILVVP